MLLLIVFLICIFIAIGTGALAALSDFRGLTIPNLYSVIVGASFALAYAVLWIGGQAGVFAPLLSHGLAALIVFGLTAAMFAFKALGAADSKLASVYALWVGLGGLVAFLFYTTLIGGVLALIGLAVKKWTPVEAPKEGSWIDRLQKGESKVPYGIAIAGGALASFFKIGYFSGEVLSSFVTL